MFLTLGSPISPPFAGASAYKQRESQCPKLLPVDGNSSGKSVPWESQSSDPMDYFTFLTVVYRKYQFFYEIGCGVYIGVVNGLSLIFHWHRSSKTPCFGMLTLILLTYIFYALMTISIAVLESLPPSLIFAIFARNNKPRFYLAFTPHLSQQIVSVAGAFVAADRVLFMTIPVKHTFLNLGRRLSVAAALVNFFTLAGFYGPIPFVPPDLMVNSVIRYVNYLTYFGVSATLTLETVLYVVFLVQFRRYKKLRRNVHAKQQAVQTNHIVLFQALSHTSLCTIPYVLQMLNSPEMGLTSPYINWIGYIERFFPAMFVTSIAFSSSFTLYKLWPRKKDLPAVTSVVAATSSK
ncbi:hypothetical protein QR680_008895 [Steinernema hermaphroditum]|uniref:Uncharacterized protein n=1 Tax=Steinernema hermaphroditum TaxID=289476 RepID=A0AA39IIC9_9BILA|nr:hypothetical protein QR680_008895 [Steinernema hermaphroditum]